MVLQLLNRAHRFVIFVTALAGGIYIGANFCQNAELPLVADEARVWRGEHPSHPGAAPSGVRAGAVDPARLNVDEGKMHAREKEIHPRRDDASMSETWGKERTRAAHERKAAPGAAKESDAIGRKAAPPPLPPTRLRMGKAGGAHRPAARDKQQKAEEVRQPHDGENLVKKVDDPHAQQPPVVSSAPRDLHAHDTTKSTPSTATPNRPPQPTPYSPHGAANQSKSACPYLPLVTPAHRLAVIVPYRDGCSAGDQGEGRKANLEEFVPYMQNFLMDQGLDYEIVVVEQVAKGFFNKGFLFNVGYLLTREHFDYVVLHDVDHVPENPNNSYGYPRDNTLKVPIHLCVAASRTNYRRAYRGMVGGALLMTREQYDDLNGFSNGYWSWGQEDDDMFHRLWGIFRGMERPHIEVGRYRSLEHGRVKGLDATLHFRHQRETLDRIKEASGKGKQQTKAVVMRDGFRQVQYAVTSATCHKSYSHYVVDYLNPNLKMEPCA